MPIVTEVGVLRYRDCIYLDSVSRDETAASLVLEGEINGSLCQPPREGFVPYRLQFIGVEGVRDVDLDSWMASSRLNAVDSFYEVADSTWTGERAARDQAIGRHFVVKTYDVVFEVLAAKFTLIFGGELGPN